MFPLTSSGRKRHICSKPHWCIDKREQNNKVEYSVLAAALNDWNRWLILTDTCRSAKGQNPTSPIHTGTKQSTGKQQCKESKQYTRLTSKSCPLRTVTYTDCPGCSTSFPLKPSCSLSSFTKARKSFARCDQRYHKNREKKHLPGCKLRGHSRTVQVVSYCYTALDYCMIGN